MQGRQGHTAGICLGSPGKGQLHACPQGNIRRGKGHRQRAAHIFGRKSHNGKVLVFLAAAFQPEGHLVAGADIFALVPGHIRREFPALAAVRQKISRGLRGQLSGAHITGRHYAVRRGQHLTSGIPKSLQLLQLRLHLCISDLPNFSAVAAGIRQGRRFQCLPIGSGGTPKLALGLLIGFLCLCQGIQKLLFRLLHPGDEVCQRLFGLIHFRLGIGKCLLRRLDLGRVFRLRLGSNGILFLLRQRLLTGIRLGNSRIDSALPLLHQAIQTALSLVQFRFSIPECLLQSRLLLRVSIDPGIIVIQFLLGLIHGCLGPVPGLLSTGDRCIVVLFSLSHCVLPPLCLCTALAPGILHRELLLMQFLILRLDFVVQIIHVQAEQHVSFLNLLSLGGQHCPNTKTRLGRHCDLLIPGRFT